MKAKPSINQLKIINLQEYYSSFRETKNQIPISHVPRIFGHLRLLFSLYEHFPCRCDITVDFIVKLDGNSFAKTNRSYTLGQLLSVCIFDRGRLHYLLKNWIFALDHFIYAEGAWGEHDDDSVKVHAVSHKCHVLCCRRWINRWSYLRISGIGPLQANRIIREQRHDRLGYIPILWLLVFE